MTHKYTLLASVLFFILFSCEKVKEPVDTSGNLRKYPTGVSFSTDVFPILQGSCGLCHSDPGDKDFTELTAAYGGMQSYGYDKLPSQPTALLSDSVNYWKQADSLVQKSAFYLLVNGSHKTNVNYTKAQSDIIYGWIIEGGANN